MFFDAEDTLLTIATYTDLAELGILPFARCELGNLYLLETDGAVHYVDYYGSRQGTKMVSETFQSFVDRIVVSLDETDNP